MTQLFPHVADRTTSTIRVASVPGTHVYVRHLSPPGATDDGVVRLPDPPRPGAPEQSPWWPPAMLDAQWVVDHSESFDVFHVHFGFDGQSPRQLGQLVGALSELDKPLVMTVHDLRNPHHPTRHVHDAQLDALVPAARALLTLTPGAAEEIRRRWQRDAVVVPHPHVVGLDEMARRHAIRRRRAPGEPARVGLHLKSARAGMDLPTVLPALVRAVEAVDGGAVLQVNGHTELLSPDGRHHDPELAALVRSLGDRIDLRVHDYLDDHELWDYLQSLDVSVLPYRFGTHSGWMEACRDLGTAVVAPTCGFYAEQGPVESYRLDEDGFDEWSLVEAVRRACAEPPPAASVAERERQRHEIAVAHRTVYLGVTS